MPLYCELDTSFSRSNVLKLKKSELSQKLHVTFFLSQVDFLHSRFPPNCFVIYVHPFSIILRLQRKQKKERLGAEGRDQSIGKKVSVKSLHTN